MFLKIGALRKFAIFTGKTPVLQFLLNKAADLKLEGLSFVYSRLRF